MKNPRWREAVMLIVKFLLKSIFRIKIRGLDVISSTKGGALIISNHVSYLDAAIFALFLPERPAFAMNKQIAAMPVFRPLVKFCKVFEIEQGNPRALKDAIEHLKMGNKLVIFPEGRITITGSLMKIYDGPGMICEKADVPVIPAYFEGCEFTLLAKLKGVYPRKIFPQVTLHIMPAVKVIADKSLNGKQRRAKLTSDIFHLMQEAAFNGMNESTHNNTVFQAVIKASTLFGREKKILCDASRKSLSYRQLFTKSFAIGEQLKKVSSDGEIIGVMLPNTLACVVTYFALQAYGRIPAMLNFTAGSYAIKAACDVANVKTIVTSRRFIEQAELSAIIQQLNSHHKVLYLEDIAAKIGVWDKFNALSRGLFPEVGYKETQPKSSLTASGEGASEKPAVILFTSGSEGKPKGVALSHANLLANRHQMKAMVNYSPNDRFLNFLPMFHSFGLLGGSVLPLLSGVRTMLYPSPLHFRIIPEVAYEFRPTVMFATDTFLGKYSRSAHPYDFSSLRFVFAGAEKLREETRRLWADKFGVRIMQGYGVTEASPVIAVNTELAEQPGTVGRIAPGIDCQLHPVEGIPAGGRLFVKGPNIMMGYLDSEGGGRVVPLVSAAGKGWHDTGDIVEIDDGGFIKISGRAKRFAKIGGEMISLSFVEELISKIWPDYIHAVVARPDEKKGEQLVLITEHQNANREAIIAYAQSSGVSELCLPKHIEYMEEIPLLSTGKINYPALS